MANIDRKDHAPVILDVDNHPVVPDPEPEPARERSRHRLQEIPRVVHPLDLPQLTDQALLNAPVEPTQRFLSTRSQFDTPPCHLPNPLRRPQAPTRSRR